MATGLATSQFLRSKSAAVMRVGSRKIMGKANRNLVGRKIITKLASASLGKSVAGGAAINHVSKLARSSAVSSTVSVVLINCPDAYRALVDKSVSWGQVAKNIAVGGASAVGGVGGWAAGAMAGAMAGSVVPIIGTAVGGFMGGLAGSITGGSAAGWGSKRLLDKMRPDDTHQVLEAINTSMAALAHDFLLTPEETLALVDIVQAKSTAALLRHVYAAPDRESFIYEAFATECEKIVALREVVLIGSFLLAESQP